MQRLTIVSMLAAGFAGLPFGVALAQSPVPSDAEILEILERRVDDERQGVGLVVGIIDEAGPRLVSYGTLSVDDPTTVDGSTVFEVGSVTKVFTTLLLADAVIRGEVTLDQPVADLMPVLAQLPERDGLMITLLDLATQSSGLPRLPDNFAPADPANPYADYTEEALYEFLSAYDLTRAVGESYEYSNIGMGLLGYALASRAGTDYATLLRERILEPLGMTNTSLALADTAPANIAVGHDAELSPVPAWTWDVLAGAGALRTTGDDMLKFIEALSGRTESELAPAFELAMQQHGVVSGDTTIGLGWNISPTDGDEMVWHNGMTYGSSAMVAYLRNAEVGAFALSNVLTPHGVDDLVSHLLVPSVELIVPRQEVAVDPAVFEGLVGTYALSPEVNVEVTAEGEQLFAQVSGQERLPIHPESETAFFYRLVDAQIEFDVNADGRATGLTLFQYGEVLPAPRAQ